MGPLVEIAKLRMTLKILVGLVLLGLLVSLPGCKTRPMRDVRLEPAGVSVKVAPGDALVFGRLKFVVNGEVMDDCTLLACPRWMLERSPRFDRDTFRRIRRGEGYAVSAITSDDYFLTGLTTEDDGSFYYLVPAGRYGVSSLENAWYAPGIYPALQFDASEPGVAHYLGTVIVDIDVTRYLGGLHGVIIRRINMLEVVDEFAEYARRLRARHPSQPPLPVRKSLMQPVPGQHPVLAPY